MKMFLLLITLLSVTTTFSQTYAKINGVTALILVPNVGIETGLGKKLTYQFDVTASFWESFNGAPFKTIMVFNEVRYFIKQKFDGFYIGGHVGGSKFELQKWNYLNTDNYQKGYNYFLGITIGYELKIDKHWLIDIFMGGGNQQGFYKGYKLSTGERYDAHTDYNKSGEWLPYRGGFMVCYKF
jgi:hypothetical protein